MKYYHNDNLEAAKDLVEKHPGLIFNPSDPRITICERIIDTKVYVDLTLSPYANEHAVEDFMEKLSKEPYYHRLVDELGDEVSFGDFKERIQNNWALVRTSDGNEKLIGPICDIMEKAKAAKIAAEIKLETKTAIKDET